MRFVPIKTHDQLICKRFTGYGTAAGAAHSGDLPNPRKGSLAFMLGPFRVLRQQ